MTAPHEEAPWWQRVTSAFSRMLGHPPSSQAALASEAVEAVEKAINDLRRRQSVELAPGRTSLDFDAVRLTEAALAAMPLEDIRRTPAANIIATYAACRPREGFSWWETFLRAAPALPSVRLNLERLKRHVSGAPRRPTCTRDRAIALALDVITTYELHQEDTRFGSRANVMASSTLIRKFVAPENARALALLARFLGSRPIASLVVLRVIRWWLSKRRTPPGQEIGDSAELAIELRQRWRSTRSTNAIPTTHRVSRSCVDLWDHATWRLKYEWTRPTELSSMAKTRGIIRSALLKPSADGLPDINALVELASWLGTSPTPDDIEDAVVLWQFWRCHGEPSKVMRLYSEGQLTRWHRMTGDCYRPNPTPVRRLMGVPVRSTAPCEWPQESTRLNRIKAEERIHAGCWHTWDDLIDSIEDPFRDLSPYDFSGPPSSNVRTLPEAAWNDELLDEDDFDEELPLEPGHWENTIRALEDGPSAFD